MAMGRPEDSYVKLPAIAHATRLGYKYVSLRDLEPGVDYDKGTNIFYEAFRSSIERINRTAISYSRAAYLVQQLRVALSSEDLGRAFFRYLHAGIEGLRLIDFEEPMNNTYQVVTELPYENGEDNFRPDIIFLVNGMPLAFMEAKRQNNREGIMAERDRMHERFRNSAFRRFVNITQLMLFSNDQEYDDTDCKPIQGSYYACSAYGKVKFNHFREQRQQEIAAYVGPRDIDTEQYILEDNNLPQIWGTPEWMSSIDPATPANRIITSLLAPKRLLFLLHYGFCYVEKVNEQGVKELQKHVMRYPQLFATLAVRDTLDAGRRKGVIWHTQGSGKTELSFLLTRYLRDYYSAQNRASRFFFIVDRLSLATQAKEEFEARGAHVALVDSREGFAKALKEPGDATGTVEAGQLPAITVVNIQKFAEEARVSGYDYDLDVQRVYFIDEAHRDYKNGGAFLTNLVTSDRDAVKLALTGTPLVGTKKNNDTKKVFGPYIHTYFYNQSIADGYTLRLLREDVKTSFRVKMQEVMRDLREIDKLVKTEDVFKHPKYVVPLVEYIVDDYIQSQVALGDESIGAMIVAHSSAQARAIYAELQKLDQDFSSALVLHDEGTKQEREKIQDDFKAGAIDFLVVYNMLLTGFDAPRLKKLYLCRTIKAHNLLQALTRVNRPYKDMAFGYVVDFADITKEYDKTNRTYLAELTQEYGDATKEYSSLFEDPAQVETELAHIRDVLFPYTTGNVVEFQAEINAIDDKHDLYELRAVLKRYRELRNVAQMLGYEELYEQFDLKRAGELLREVDNRIQLINYKEAMKLQDMSTGAVNVLLDQIEFSFRNVGENELAVADEFTGRLRKTYAAFASNRDPKDPEYVSLLDKLREKFSQMDIEEMTTDDMVASIEELKRLKAEMDELNRRNEQLAKKYGGDMKFMRVHKKAMRTPPPLTTSPAKLFTILSKVKAGTDGELMHNEHLLDNEGFFKRTVRRLVLISCDNAGVDGAMDTIDRVAGDISREYFEEKRKAS
jgi:type I restriction enzyme R subunit